MFEAVANVFPRVEALRVLDCVQRDIHGLVADGVHGHSPSLAMQFRDLLLEGFRIPAEHAMVVGLIDVWLPEIRAHAVECAVENDFERADVQQAAFETGADAQIESESFRKVSGKLSKIVEGREIRHQRAALLDESLFVCGLEQADIVRGLSDALPIAIRAGAGVGIAGDAVLQRAIGGELQLVQQRSFRHAIG